MEGYHSYDDYGWKNSRNSLSDLDKRCPSCGGLKRRSSSLCNTCSHDREKNRQYMRQFNFRQMMRELREERG